MRVVQCSALCLSSMALCTSLGLSFGVSASAQCANATFTVGAPPNVPQLTAAFVRSDLTNSSWLIDQPLYLADLAPLASTLDLNAGISTRILPLPVTTLDAFLFLPASLGSLGCLVKQDWTISAGNSTCDVLDVPASVRSSSASAYVET